MERKKREKREKVERPKKQKMGIRELAMRMSNKERGIPEEDGLPE